MQSMQSMHSKDPQQTFQHEAIATTDIASTDKPKHKLQATTAEQLPVSPDSPCGGSHDTPKGCQLSRGCPGEMRSYSAEEEPGWFPEMEKVTAKVLQQR